MSKYKQNYDDVCVQCGECRGTIKRKELGCGIMSGGEEPELEYEWNRHRYRPYTKKELDAMLSDEDEKYRQMGEMADFIHKEMDKDLNNK